MLLFIHAKLNFDGVVRPLSTPPAARLPLPFAQIMLEVIAFAVRAGPGITRAAWAG